MKIIPLKYYDGGYVAQTFAFGGTRDKAACDANTTYPSSLQNFLIDDGKDVILSDTGLPNNSQDIVPKQGSPLWMGKKVATFEEALAKTGYKPQDITKIIVTHKHPDHTGELRMFPHAKIYISQTEADTMKLTGANIVRVNFTDGPYKNFPESQRITDTLVMVRAEGHTKGNSIAILQDGDIYYMFHGERMRLCMKMNCISYLKIKKRPSKHYPVCVNFANRTPRFTVPPTVRKVILT